MRTRLVLTAALLGSFVALPLSSATTARPAKPYGTTWVVNGAGNMLLGYGPHAAGTAGPIVKIRGAATGLDAPSAVAVSSTGKLFVANAGNNSITEYAADANGNATPIATIAGSRTGLDAPSSLVLSGGEIWVTNPDSNLVEAFTAGESGNILPAETIVGHKTKLDHPVAIAVDTEADFITTIAVVNNPPAGHASILSFTSSKRGNVAPSSQTSGTRKHPFVSPTAISQLGFANYLVADSGNDSISEMLMLPELGLRGGPTNPAFVRIGRFISGSHTGIDNPTGITHDAVGGAVITNAGDHSLRDFGADATGNAAPVRVISGVGTAAGSPSAAAVFGAAPGVPTDLRARLRKSAVSLAWRRPAVTGGGLAGYLVLAIRGSRNGQDGSFGYLSVVGVGENPLDVTTTKTRYTKRHIQPGRRYYFTVAAVNGFGTSRFVRPVQIAHVIPPSSPRHVKAYASTHSVLVNWKPSRRDGGANVRYLVRYAAGCRPGTKGCKTHKIVATRFTEGTQRIRGLKRHAAYDFEVLARNKAGTSPPSTVVTATTN